MIAFASAVVAALVVGLVLLKGVLGWGAAISRSQRLALCMIGAGIVWAGPGRYLELPPGLGDLLFVSGIAVHIFAVHGGSLWRAVTEEDPDGPFD